MKHLKLFFALFAMLALGVTNAWAETAEVDFSTLYSADTDVSSTTFSVVEGISLAFNKGTGSTAPKYYQSGTAVRLYAKGTMTVSSTIGKITKITLAYGSSDKTNTISVNCGSFSTSDWTGEADEVIFTIDGTSGHRRIKSVEVTYTPSAGGETPDPTPTTQYTVKWYTALGTSTDVTLDEGAAITKPATDPTMSGYEFMGWTDQCSVAEDGTGFTALTDFGTADADKEFYAVFAVATTTSGGESSNYEKVTAALADWSGDYLIAYNNTTFADGRTGGTSGMGAQNKKVDLSSNISNNAIPASVGDQYNVTLEAVSGGYVLKTKDGNYNYQSSNANGLATTKTIATAASYAINVTFTSENDIKLALTGSAAGAVFRYNTQGYFRFYKNGGQSAVYLYKKTSGGGSTTTYDNYITTCSGSTPVENLTDAQFAWSAATAEATMGATNTFPTLTNTVPVSVTYESSNTSTATIVADGTITLVAPGTTTISAKFAGGEVSGTTYAAKTVTYTLTVLKAPATPTGTVYVKVTDVVTDGEYLIVYETGNVAFNGALTTLDVTNNTVEVAISDNKIIGNTDIDAATFTIDVANGTILSASGKYIAGKSSNDNGINISASALENSIAIDGEGNAVIISNSKGLRYNKTAGQTRFRYFKDNGGTQEQVALYKKASSHTLTYGTCTNGSVSADVADGATVLSGTTITLSNTPTTDYKLSAYDVYKTDDATTKVTVADGKFIMPEFDVTISATFVPAKTLKSIEITSAATQTTFWQGETFNYTGLEVTAHFDGAADEVVTPTVTGSTATAGTQTVTVSYTEGTVTKSTTYEITVKATANTEATAYDIATALEIIDKVSTANDIYVTGIVSEIVTAYNATYGNITYNISADGLTTSAQLQAFRGKSFNGENFASADDVQVGDEVVVFGNLLKYNSTYELAADNKLISLNRNKTAAGLAYETTEYTANVNEAFTAPTLTNPNGLTVTYSTSDATLATVDAATGAVTIGNKTGKVTITATFAGNETYLYGTASYNITISDPSLLEATFDATVDLGNTERGEGEITKSPITFACTDGILGNSSEYRLYQNATISFTAENGYAITKVVITSTASGTSQYGPGHLSTENGTYSVSDKTGTWVGEAQTVTFTATAQSRAKLITVYYKTDNRQDAGLVWSTENVSITLGDAFTAPTLSNPNGLTLTCTSDNENLATVTNAGVVTLKSGVTGKATITAKFDGNSDYKDATVTCTITVNPKTETVVILAKYGDQWYALKNVEETTGKVLAALPVNYVGGKLYSVEEADKATIEWQRAAVTDGIIFKNGENYIYGTAGSTDLKLSTTECAWTLDGSTYKIGDRTFIYRAQANGFKNYNATTTPGTDDYSTLPVVTAPVYGTGDAYGRTVNLGEDNYRFGTICLPYGSTNYTGATFYEIVGTQTGGIVLGSVDALVAGTPYIFRATATEVAVYSDGTSAATAGNSNGLYGTFEDNTVVAANEDNHILYNNAICLVAEACYVDANRAYIVMSEVPTEPVQQMPGRRYIGMSVQGENGTTGLDNIMTTDAPAKVIVNGQLIIIRNGEKYNVQGQKL